jgi:predicted RNase H-like nuclease (RuvC/YqgF family)
MAVDKDGNEIIETPTNTTTSTGSQIDFEALIAKARQDEKNKLYPQIEKLKAELESKTAKMNDLLLSGSEKDDVVKTKDAKIAELEKKITELTEKEGKHVETSKEAKELQKKIDELEQKIADKDKEIATKELESYRKEKVAGLDDSVIDLVSGLTKEEIDASIEKAKVLYEKISSKFGEKKTEEKKQEDKTKVPLPNVNLNDSEKMFKDATPEDFRDMDISTKEGRAHWEKMRKELGIAKK